MRVVLAEDESTTRMLISRMLARWGFEVVPTDDGEKAWALLNADDAPPLAVLDWMMPGMDGIELCRRMRAREQEQAQDRRTYIILVTGRDRGEDMARALGCGADDYLTKPLSAIEFQARLGVAKRAIAYEEKLQQYAQQMEQLAEARAEQLVGQERMATLGVMSAGVAHEINNPTSFISGNTQTLERFWTDIADVIATEAANCQDPELSRKLTFVQKEFPRTLTGIQQGVQRIAKIVGGLQAYARQKPGKRRRIAIGECLEKAAELTAYQTKQAGVTVERTATGGDTVVRVDAQQIEQVLVNLIVNATHACEGLARPTVWLRARAVSEGVELEVEDFGPGVPPEVQARIWDPFFTTKEAGKGTGLGLAICQKIAADHGGAIELRQEAGRGACFVLRLPRAAASVDLNEVDGDEKARAS